MLYVGGADGPPEYKKSSLPGDADHLLITPVNKPIFYATKGRLGNSLSMLDILKSLENLNQPDSDSSELTSTTKPKSNLSRQKSRSCEGLKILNYKKSPPATMELIVPKSVARSQDFSLKFAFTNLLRNNTKVFLSLRLDFGRKKLKMVKSTACLAHREVKEILLNFDCSDVWPEMRGGDDNYFTVLATAHLEGTGDVLTKVDRIELAKQPQKKFSFLGRHH